MTRRLFAACALLMLLASMIAMPASASRSCCCRKAAGCPMHLKHDGAGCRLDRCNDRDSAAAGVAAVRAVLVVVVLPQPIERDVTFAVTRHVHERRANTPLHPPPRVV